MIMYSAIRCTLFPYKNNLKFLHVHIALFVFFLFFPIENGGYNANVSVVSPMKVYPQTRY